MGNYIQRHTRIEGILVSLVALMLFCMAPLEMSAGTIDKAIGGAIVVVDSDTDRELMDRYISSFHRHPEVAQKLIERAHLYFPTIEKELLRKGMPRSLRVLPLIESSFRPSVSSRVGAKGLWQMMPGTAREMGLRINRYMDERCDPTKSTRAAMAYMQFLYEEYGDWSMALAAYNCGPGRVNRAIKASGGQRDFEGVKPFLPRETREYLPKVAAAQYVFDNLHEYGYGSVAYDRDLQLTTLVSVYEQIKLSEVAEAIGMSEESIDVLNPGVRRGYLPNSAGGYSIRIPQRHKHAFAHYLATGEVSPTRLKTFLEKSEITDDVSIFDLARELQVNPFDLMVWNSIKDRNHEIKSGETVRYYVIEDPAKREVKLPELRIKSALVALLPARLDFEKLLQFEILRQKQIEEEKLAFLLHSN